MLQLTPTVKQLLIINVIFYIGSNFVGNVAYDLLSLHYFQNENFGVWQLITHMFMHARFPSITHILFNMFALYSFGTALEQIWGGRKFLFFYLSCGVGAAMLHMGINYIELQGLLGELSSLNLSSAEIYTLLNMDFKSSFDSAGQLINSDVSAIVKRVGMNQEQFNVLQQAIMVNKIPMVGASGAIYGLLAAFAFMFPNAELSLLFLPIPIKAKYFVPGILLIDLVLGFQGNAIFGGGGSGVAHFAHIGGALTGFLMMYYWKKNQFNQNRWD